MKKIKIAVPATVANLVCGFDILGMALNDPYDIMELELIDEPIINIKHTDDYGLPESPEQNVAGVALQALMEDYGKGIGFNVTVHKTYKTRQRTWFQCCRFGRGCCCCQSFT